MILDIILTEVKLCEVYTTSVHNNFNLLIESLGIYQHLWRPDELNITHARQLIAPLESALENLEFNKEKYRKHEPPGMCGKIELFIIFLKNLLESCKQHPNATISVCR